MSGASLPRRLWLPCPIEAVNAELDRLCARLRRQAVAYGYLSLQAPLVANLNLLENLWLPHAWRGGLSRRAVLLRLEELLGPGGSKAAGAESLGDPVAWLQRRPSQLSPAELELAVVLRAALGRPKLVVLDRGWPGRSASMALLEQTSWWLCAPELEPWMQAQDWITMGVDAACDLLA
jgi:hypothetical protein